MRRETLIRISEAPKHIPGRPHISTVWRWVLNGVRGRKLETITAGGRRFTSLEAIDRFIQSDGDTTAAPTSNATSKAEAELDAAGW